MKQFLIRYKRGNGTKAQWHEDIQRFIAAVVQVSPLEIVAQTRAA